MIGQYYRAVEIGSPEPVNYVGVHPLIWHDHPEQPEMGFTEEKVYPKEFIEWLVFGCDVKQHYNSMENYGFEINDAEKPEILSMEDIYEYWEAVIKK